MSRRCLLTSIVLFALAPGAAVAQTGFELVAIAGDLYRFQDGERAGVVLVAGDGILVADPLTEAAGRALRDGLATRFPGKRVLYVVNTSHVYERAAGSASFPEATFTAHRLFNPRLLEAARTLPASLRTLDMNRNNQLDRDEWDGAGVTERLAAADADRNRVITSREAYSVIPQVKGPFLGLSTLDVAGRLVQFPNPGGDYRTFAVFFPDRRVLFTGHNSAIGRDGLSFGDMEPDGLIAWLRAILEVPFDTAVTGRGDLLTRADVESLASEAEDLRTRATDAYTRGLSAEAATATTGPSTANMAAIFDSLRATRTELQGAAFVRWMSTDGHYCAGYDTCPGPGHITGGSAGLRVTSARLGAVLELSWADQSYIRRDGEFDGEALAQRSSRASFLFRYGAARPSARSMDLVVGPTVVLTDTEGVTHVKEAVAPIGGRHPFSARYWTVAVTAGATFVAPVTRAMSVIVPVRVTTYLTPPNPNGLGGVDVQAGLGLAFRVTQRVR